MNIWCLCRVYLHVGFLFIGSEVITRRQALETALKSVFVEVSRAEWPCLCGKVAAC